MLNCDCLHVLPKQVNIRRIPPRPWDNPFDACSPGGRKPRRGRESSSVRLVGLMGRTLGVRVCARACVSGTETFESRPGFISECPRSYEISFP